MPKMPAPTRTPRWPRSPPASRTGRLSDRRQNRNGDDAPGHERHLPAGGVASRSTNSGEWTASGSPHAMHNSGGCDAGAAPRSRIVCRGGGADDGLFGPRPGKEDQDRRDFRPHRSARRRRVGAAIYRRRGFTNATARAGRPISSNRERPSCVRRLRRAIYFGSCTQRRGILILPNPWDAGTAKLLASLGFEALATTSLGMSNALGRVDGEGSVSRAELLENCRVIAEANVVMSAADPALTAAEMEAVGVKRLSVGGALSRLALAAFMKGAREMKEQGGFTWVRDAMPTRDLKAVFGA